MASLLRTSSLPSIASGAIPAIPALAMQRTFRPAFQYAPASTADLSPASQFELAAPVMHIGGHRGMGENLHVVGLPTATIPALVPELRENTLASFKAAAEMGCTFVEFDVQVTQDGVAVIWHDDDIIMGDANGGSISCKVKDLTLKEFLNIIPESTESNLSLSDIDCASEDARLNGLSDDELGVVSPQISTVGVSPPASAISSCSGRRLMRKFKDAQSLKQLEGHQPWLHINDIDHNLPTLRDMFTSLPKSLAFNIEVKMTTGEDEEFTCPEELERMVEGVMSVVDVFCPPGEVSEREMFFSSFDPDICAMLKDRLQFRFPVYFLSGCGLYKHIDARRTSIQTALSVASSSGLTGVVVPAGILLSNPQIVGDARTLGLGVMTYGHENSQAEVIQLQRELGVVATIVDSVATVLPRLKTSSELQRDVLASLV